ncbi:MAG: hypothetical protein AB1346_04660 [Thermodesulfobacteriota bacterium]
MNHPESIVERYRDGNPDVRMEIYLANPSLRSRLDEIEKEEKRGDSPVSDGSPTAVR